MKKIALLSCSHNVYGGGQVYLDEISKSNLITSLYNVDILSSDDVYQHRLLIPRMDTWSNKIKNISSVIKLLNEKNYDYIILNDISISMLSVFFRVFTKAKIVSLIHMEISNVVTFKSLSRIISTIRSFLINIGSHLILSVSKSNDSYLSRKKTKFIGNFVDNSYYPKGVKNFNKNEINLLYVGRLAFEKNLYYLIDLVERMNIGSELTCNLSLVGSGEYKGKLERYVIEKKIKNNIRFIGFLPREKIQYYYERSDFLILTSKTEGFPTVILEAAKFGIPYIAPAVGSISHIYNEFKSGILIPNDDVDLATKIIKKKINSYCEMSDKTQELVECYSMDRVMIKIRDYLYHV